MSRRPSNTFSFQHGRMDCFAHAATHIIFHNVYNLRLTEEDRQRYNENQCYLHLDTTKEIEDTSFEALTDQCGKTGSMRILAFLYIYKFITRRFGCDYGHADNSINYYLRTPLYPVFESDELNARVMRVLSYKTKESFVCSHIKMAIFMNYKKYLEEYFANNYYCLLRLETPAHFVTITGMDGEGSLSGKDSWVGAKFTIPFNQFHPNGTVTIQSNTWKGISGIFFVYEKEHIGREFRSLLLKNVTAGKRKTRRIKNRR